MITRWHFIEITYILLKLNYAPARDILKIYILLLHLLLVIQVIYLKGEE